MKKYYHDIANEMFDVMPDLKQLEEYSNYLVKYCSNICKTVSGDQIDDVSLSYQLGRVKGAEVCHIQIRKHFGIEL
jgi:hypothetical protein